MRSQQLRAQTEEPPSADGGSFLFQQIQAVTSVGTTGLPLRIVFPQPGEARLAVFKATRAIACMPDGLMLVEQAH